MWDADKGQEVLSLNGHTGSALLANASTPVYCAFLGFSSAQPYGTEKVGVPSDRLEMGWRVAKGGAVDHDQRFKEMLRESVRELYAITD